MTGCTAFHAAGLAQTIPVPRGPKSHLWQPAMRKSQRRSATLSFSTPTACTPSTDKSTRSPSSRLAFASAIASAILRMGSLSPVLECTQVTAKRRVFGVSAFTTLATISSSETASSLS